MFSFVDSILLRNTSCPEFPSALNDIENEEVNFMHHLTVIEDPKMKQCIEDCSECGDVCLATMSHCLHTGGEHSALAHINLMLDCTSICRLTADYMLRGSEFSSELCQLCAEINDHCASDCEKFSDDEQMQACARACRKCADSCREMAAM